MPEILLDTHILIWWRQNAARLTHSSRQLLSAMERRNRPIAISAITLWELAQLVERGRLEVEEPLTVWLEEIESHPLIEVLPLTARIAAESTKLGLDFHKDPADRIIVATARIHGLRLLTADDRIRAWGRVAVI